jgi:hypothetical protein
VWFAMGQDNRSKFSMEASFPALLPHDVNEQATEEPPEAFGASKGTQKLHKQTVHH